MSEMVNMLYQGEGVVIVQIIEGHIWSELERVFVI